MQIQRTNYQNYNQQIGFKSKTYRFEDTDETFRAILQFCTNNGGSKKIKFEKELRPTRDLFVKFLDPDLEKPAMEHFNSIGLKSTQVDE